MRKLVVAAVVGLVVVLGTVSWQAAVAASPDRSASDLDRPGAGPGAQGHRGAVKPGENKPDKNKPGRKDRAGGTILVGTVKSVQDGKLEVTKDSGGDVTVTVEPGTKARGVDLTGLEPGQRVVVRVKDGKAVRVTVPQTRAQGTVTAVDGNQATLVGFDGSKRALDLSGLEEKPQVGDLVAVRGTTVGDALRVERLRQLPK